MVTLNNCDVQKLIEIVTIFNIRHFVSTISSRLSLRFAAMPFDSIQVIIVWVFSVGTTIIINYCLLTTLIVYCLHSCKVTVTHYFIEMNKLLRKKCSILRNLNHILRYFLKPILQCYYSFCLGMSRMLRIKQLFNKRKIFLQTNRNCYEILDSELSS